jgi:4'-phosphopantetheinyl transferase EntD
LIDYRSISAGDEFSLLPEEFKAFEASVTKVRRASGAARIVARQLLARLGYAQTALPKAPSGAPRWPSGVIGSLAHDSAIAVAAVAMRRNFRALGVDTEPTEALPADLMDVVATPRERTRIFGGPFYGRLLFSAKEAVYKAVYPIDETFLDHHDVEVNFVDQKAYVRNGRTIDIRFSISSHIVVLAFSSGLTNL